MTKKNRLQLLQILMAVGIVLLDQVTKVWALNTLKTGGDITVIPGVFYLSYATNNGAAWSMFAGQRALLLLVSAGALILMLWLLKKNYIDTNLGRFSIYMVMGGAFGNLIDRALRTDGRVIDLFDFRLIHFPIFNVADVFICVGGGLFALYTIRTMLREYRGDQAAAEEQDDGEDKQ
ncbi:MAG: signal peptidase II [Ruminococcaceae bacterium]|nr:signal peptidase II [Oscillospiraceae bacterium]